MSLLYPHKKNLLFEAHVTNFPTILYTCTHTHTILDTPHLSLLTLKPGSPSNLSPSKCLQHSGRVWHPCDWPIQHPTSWLLWHHPHLYRACTFVFCPCLLKMALPPKSLNRTFYLLSNSNASRFQVASSTALTAFTLQLYEFFLFNMNPLSPYWLALNCPYLLFYLKSCESPSSDPFLANIITFFMGFLSRKQNPNRG